MTIPEIFAEHGEPYFRAGEARVIARLLGGRSAGAGHRRRRRHGCGYTRDLIHIKGVSVWLKADLDVLMKRTKRRSDRPLAEKMKDLMPLREPFYAQSDIVVQSREEPHDMIVEEIIAALPRHLDVAAESAPSRSNRHDRAAARQRTDRGAGRARRARLRHRDRPRADRPSRRAHQGAARRRARFHRHRRMSPAIISPRPRPRSTPPASSPRASWCRRARARKATPVSNRCARPSSPPASSAAISSSRSAAA